MSHLVPSTFLVTGSTDGIGLLTAQRLIQHALKQDLEQTVIGIHGRCPKRIEDAIASLQNAISPEKKQFIKLVTFCYDLSDIKQVNDFVVDVIKQFTPEGLGFKLDVLINNAAIFDDKGPRKCTDGQFELTFAVNVVAPFIITYKLLNHAYETTSPILKVINTSSTSHTDCSHHLCQLDYNNLQFEGGLKWSSFNAYGVSKLLVIMLTRGFYYHQEWIKKISPKTCLINMDPGTVNTKMLIAGWGACGIPVEKATDTFKLAVDMDFYKPNMEPKYYVSLQDRKATPLCYNQPACLELFEYMVKLCNLN